ncbi:Uncharacterised protein [Bordetella trematum]|uniref:Uncharacterized protein n=1 Tax=Bordetella trematum TaxID=123899 RepID=A0A157R9I0_9BORD|nr:Uncharacterised protein [Bordetella trematum]SAI61859.1 Uncharacterised protein [Bordetella trematum]SAI69023.1 Uncharacterised protein [Bordetella trematum]SUV99447.1 Uncharacterised protein [Bordetella trematum]
MAGRDFEPFHVGRRCTRDIRRTASGTQGVCFTSMTQNPAAQPV